MQYTPNFNFSIAEGTDTVNLLTQSYPNFSNLDTILENIKATGITKATHTKVGTVHELVRVDADCEVFRFVATSNFAVNDTFTVDGVAVTTTAMDGSALPAGAFVINQSVEAILNGLVLTIVGVKGLSSVNASDVTYDNTGSGLAATNAQDAIDEVETNVETLATTVGNIPVIKSANFSGATMTAGLLNIGNLVGEPFTAILGVKITSVPAGFAGYAGSFADFGGTARMTFFTAAGDLIVSTETGFSGNIYYI